jgi:hypothetical protein
MNRIWFAVIPVVLGAALTVPGAAAAEPGPGVLHLPPELIPPPLQAPAAPPVAAPPPRSAFPSRQPVILLPAPAPGPVASPGCACGGYGGLLGWLASPARRTACPGGGCGPGFWRNVFATGPRMFAPPTGPGCFGGVR